MATTENNYTLTDTSKGPYTFTFPYIKEADVKVSKNGTPLLTTEYTQATTSITLVDTPTIGDKIRIYRVTSDTNLAATFYPGSAIRSADLNDNFTQNLYTNQDVVSRYLDKQGTVAWEGDMDAGDYQLTNVDKITSTKVQVGTGVPGDNSGTAIGTLITNGSIDTQADTGNVFIGRQKSDGAATSTIGYTGSAAFDGTVTAQNTIIVNRTGNSQTCFQANKSGVSKAWIDSEGATSFAATNLEIDSTGQLTIKKAASYTDPSFRILDRNNSNADGVLMYGNGLAHFKGAQFSGNVTPTAGEGVEIFQAAAGVGQISSYDRDTPEWNVLRIKAAHIEISNNGSASEHVRITSGGNVGIGTSTPGQYLDVESNSNTSARITAHGYICRDNWGSVTNLGNGMLSPAVNTLAFTTNSGERMRIASDGSFRHTPYGDTSTETYLKSVGAVAEYTFRAQRDGSVDTAFSFETQNSGTLDEALRITSDGKVGIGNSSPGAALDVKDSTTTKAYFKHSSSNETSLYIEADDTSARIGSTYHAGSGAFKPLEFLTSGSTKMSILADGNVGIGTSSPKYKVCINHDGSTTSSYNDATALRIDGPGAADELAGIGFGYFNSGGNTPDHIPSSWIGVEATDWTSYVKTDLIFATRNVTTNSEPTERMRILADGNVGIGTALTDDFGAGHRVVQVHSTTTANAYLSLTNTTTGDQGAGAGLNLIAYGNDAVITNRSDGYMSFSTHNEERMQLHSDGYLLVNTTTSRIVEDNVGNGPQGKIQIEATDSDAIMSIISAGTSDANRCGTLSLGRHRNSTIGDTPTVVQNNDALGAICFAGGDGSDMRTKGAQIVCQVDGAPSGDDMPGRLVFSTTSDGLHYPEERMRITNDGTILFGTSENNIGTSAFGTRISGSNVISTSRNVAGTSAVAHFYGNAGELRVKGDGDCENTNNSYGSISDVKLKENIVDANSQWNDIKALKVRNYNFKESTGFSTHKQIGLIAQEVESISPGLVGETNDTDSSGNETGTVTKSISYSVLNVKVVKALQEAMAKIETLETKVAALEAA